MHQVPLWKLSAVEISESGRYLTLSPEISVSLCIEKANFRLYASLELGCYLLPVIPDSLS